MRVGSNGLLRLVTPIAFLGAIIVGCKKPAPPSAELTSAQQPVPTVKVQTTPVVEQTMPEYLTLTGSLRGEPGVGGRGRRDGQGHRRRSSSAVRR